MRFIPRYRETFTPLGLFLLAALIVGATVDGPGLTWDEPTYLNSQLGVEQWLGKIIQTRDPSLFSNWAIDAHWDYNRLGANFHPPMAGYLNLLTHGVYFRWFDDLPSRRLASVVEFALCVAALGAFIGARYGWTAGWFAGLSLLFMPRVVGDAHIMGTDMPLMMFWSFAALAYWKARTAALWQWIFAALIACLFLVKFNGLAIGLPLGLWFVGELVVRGIVFGDRSVWRLALGLVWKTSLVAPMLAVAFNPTWWHDPLGGLQSFIRLNTHRQGLHPDIAIYFFGRKYVNSLPWPNAFVLMALTIPWGTLIVGAAGCVVALRDARDQPLGLYLLLHCFALPVVRMFPTPAHDGVRLFLPTFFFWAALAGIAARSLATSRRWLWPVLFVVGPIWSAVDWYRWHPHELSYYNIGLAAATTRGFETTYWYDAVTPAVVRDLNDGPRRLPDGIPIIAHLDRTTNTETFLYLQRWGRLRADLVLDPKPITCKTWAFLLMHSSKSTALKRLLARCPPHYDSRFSGVTLFAVYTPRALNVATALAALAVERGAVDEYRAARPFEPAFAARDADFAAALAAYRDGKTPVEPGSLAEALLRHWTTNDFAAAALPQLSREDPAALDRAIAILHEHSKAVREAIVVLRYHPPADTGAPTFEIE